MTIPIKLKFSAENQIVGGGVHPPAIVPQMNDALGRPLYFLAYKRKVKSNCVAKVGFSIS